MDGEWIALIKLEYIPEGISGYRKKRKRIAVVKDQGEIVRVFEDNCPHNNRIMLSENAFIEFNLVTCRLHGKCFNLNDGNTTKGLAGEDNKLRFFEYQIENDILMVKI